MVVRKKEEKEVERQRFIAKGGSSPKATREWTTFCLRIPQDMIREIEMLKDKRAGLTRNAWILEAIQEKLRKDITDD